MKTKFKWVLTVELDIDEDIVGTDCPYLLNDEAVYVMECAQDRFFDTLNSNDSIASWEVLDEELK